MASFANNCLLARRLIERGVRIVQLYDADWDHHANLAKRAAAKVPRSGSGNGRASERPAATRTVGRHARDVGRRIRPHALAARDFGRWRKTKPGRDHHKDAYTIWLAGGGIKGGTAYGQTDELGFNPAENPVHVHDLNATVLHLLGIDHERLTFKYQGREYRLTDVGGKLVTGLLA